LVRHERSIEEGKKMYSKALIGVVVLLSFCSCLKACPNIQGCSFDNSDCTSLTCQKTILGKTVYLTIKLDTCKTDLSATITVNEYSSGISFTHTFKGQGDVPIPGLSFGVASANIRVKIYRENSNIMLEVSLVLKSIFTSDTSYVIVKSDIGTVNCGNNAVSSWFSDQSLAIKIVIIASAVVAVLSVIGCIACCCRCCRQKAGGVVVASPNLAGPVVMENMPQVPPPYQKF